MNYIPSIKKYAQNEFGINKNHYKKNKVFIKNISGYKTFKHEECEL